MATELAFGVTALVVIVAAWRAVTSPDIVRAALALVVVLAGMAPLFVLLAAEFLAVTQVLVYVGAVVVLLIFGIMLTRRPAGASASELTDHQLDHRWRWAGLTAAIALFGALWTAISDTFGHVEVDPASPITVEAVGRDLLRDQFIAFELASVLLLAALIGAIAVARRVETPPATKDGHS